jgi:hypothetical protein
MKICIIKLGNMVESAIDLVCLGRGKEIAQEIAGYFGYKDCGCDKRKAWLNKIVGCDPSPIKLDFNATDTESTGTRGSHWTDRKKSGHPLSKH